jgi:hypothetical protein
MSRLKNLSEQPWVLGLLVAFPSSGIVHKYTGTFGLLGYLLGVIVIFSVLKKFGLPFSKWWRKNFKFTAAAVFLAFAACFAVVYPIENSKGPGKSSDRDQGLNISAGKLMHGENPYYEDEPDAGPLSVLPGSIILASPFVAAGNSAYQNLFWLAAFVVFAAFLFRDRMLALTLIAVSLALSPSAMHEFISGGDLMSNGIYVAVFSILALRAWTSENPKNAWRWVSLILFGMALASRPNFLFILPLFGALLWRETSFGKAITASSSVFLAFCALTLPFYFSDPDGFTPLVARAKIEIPGIPWASVAVIIITAALTIASSFALLLRRNDNPTVAFARKCALVILAPMIAMVILRSISSGGLDFEFMRDRFGLMYLPFALIGWRMNFVDGTGKCQSHAA